MSAIRDLQDVVLTAQQAAPDWLKDLVRPVVGRVISNVFPPYDYNQRDPWPTLPAAVKGVLTDTPAYNLDPDANDKDYNSSYGRETTEARRSLLRAYFDLHPQDHQNMFLKQGKNWEFNPAHPTGGQMREYFPTQPTSHTDGLTITNPVLGRYLPGSPDKWDFALHPDEVSPNAPMSISQFARQWLENLGRPVTVATIK